jgi:hypothetical protein
VRLLEAIASADRESLNEMLADDVVFHSPVQTYRGRDQTVLLLVTVGGVIEEVEATREVDGVTFFAATLEEHPMDGVLVEVEDAAGHISEVTLMMRPLAQLQAAVARMTRALTSDA